MKKIVVLLAVVALTAPVFAQDVAINLSTRVEAGPTYWVDFSYDATAAGQLVRGFSFDVELDNGGTLMTVDGYKAQGDPTDVMSSSAPGKTKGYGVYFFGMTFDFTDPLNPLITYEEDPVADGQGALNNGVLGGSGLTLECGSLYDPAVPADAPDPTGFLFSIEVSKLVTAMTLTADEDDRGGIVLEDGTVANLIAPTFMVAWGLDTQCHSDGDGNGTVNTVDFGYLRDSWFKSYPDPLYDPRADADRNGTVNTVDFGQLRDNWFKSAPADCNVGMHGEVWPPII